MSDGELRFPEWQTPLRDLLLEFDCEKLPEEVQKVETLIFGRLQQLEKGDNSHEERVAIYDAVKILRIVKRDKLGSPDWT
jgi:hypothetical protein